MPTKQRHLAQRRKAHNEAEYINNMLRWDYGVQCAVVSAQKTPGFIFYQLALAPNENISNVSKLMEDIERRIRAYRESNRMQSFDRNGMPEDASVRLDSMAPALEVSRHDRKKLTWGKRQWQRNEFTALAGRFYSAQGGFPVIVDVSDPNQAHALIAGTTGSGKSILQEGMVCGFAESTHPDKLRMVFVDLDSNHFHVFKRLPHTHSIADEYEGAVQAIDYAAAQMNGDPSVRTLLVIDELTQLVRSGNKAETEQMLLQLEQIASRGRKHGVHMLLATQKPLSKEIGPLVKGNITVRFCGAVNSYNDSNTALDSAGHNADKLPGYGAFIYRHGNNVRRIQAYMLDDARSTVADIRRLWSVTGPVMAGYDRLSAGYEAVTQPVMAGYGAGYERLQSEKSQNALVSFPLGEGRPLTDPEAQAVRRFAESGQFDYRGRLSLTQLTMRVYGSKSPERLQWIKDALHSDDEKVIRLRRGA